MLNQALNALGSNAITNALGFDFGSIATPSKFLTKFTPATIFTARSLAYELHNSKNFDVIFHWHPTHSQIRTYFSNAFAAADTDDINLLIRNISIPNLINNPSYGNDTNPKFRASMPGLGVNGNGVMSMRFLNTEFSYVNHCFYQWLRETESPYWLYGPSVSPNIGTVESRLKELGTKIFATDANVGNDGTSLGKNLNDVLLWMSMEDASKLIYLRSESETAPFTRADIQIRTYSGNMKELHSIWFFGAYPTTIQLDRLDHNPVSQTDLEGYTVSFSFDSMTISSPFVARDDSKASLSNAAAKMFGEYSNSPAWTAGLYDDTLTQIGNTYLAKASRKMNKIMSKKGSEISSKLQDRQKRLTA